MLMRSNTAQGRHAPTFFLSSPLLSASGYRGGGGLTARTRASLNRIEYRGQKHETEARNEQEYALEKKSVWRTSKRKSLCPKAMHAVCTDTYTTDNRRVHTRAVFLSLTGGRGVTPGLFCSAASSLLLLLLFLVYLWLYFLASKGKAEGGWGGGGKGQAMAFCPATRVSPPLEDRR